MPTTTAHRETAHAVAAAAWNDTSHKSRVAGLAERLRSAKNPRPLNPERRKAERAAFAARQKRSVEQAKHTAPVYYGGKEYRHQGAREIARRLRQIAAGQINASGGLRG